MVISEVGHTSMVTKYVTDMGRINVVYISMVNPLGTGKLKFYQFLELTTFWELFIFFN